LAFDAANYRLGYGGGYYDGFLRQHPEAYKLGICYPFQKVKQVPLEAHDVRLDAVLAKVAL
jgi:5-formyltetrahydrofolate cyclo-ligase